VAVIGDSLSDPKVAGGGYLNALRKGCPETRIENFAKGGAMVNQMRRTYDRLVKSAPAGSFSHLVLFGGVNDLYSDLTAFRTPDKIMTDLTYMYEDAGERGMRVVAITVAPWGGFTRYFNERRAGYTRELNDWIRAQVDAQSVDVVIDAYALLSCDDKPEVLCKAYEQRVPDGLHPGPAGHEVLGKALFEQAFADCR
jgi:lysophospholipase L1-like esterase